MSKNYEQIATVDIDIESPIVDDTSFDNLLIMGPGPAKGPKPPLVIPDVGVYSDISEVEALGFVTTGEGADPVGVAARVAFSQSPKPTAVYIAIQKKSAEAVAAAQTIEDTNAVLTANVGTKEGLTGCTVIFDDTARRLYVDLTGPVTGVKNTGLVDALTALTEQGYTVSVGGKKVTDAKSLKALPVFSEIAAMTKGGESVKAVVDIEKEGALGVSYGVTVAYPDPDNLREAAEGEVPVEDEPLNDPTTEVEAPADTIRRALATNGWYVLCTAGVDASQYEDIAAAIESNEKLFLYTELGFFGKGKDGANEATVGAVYYRTIGIYGRESTSQPDEEIPDANLYANVAFAAKWLNYSSGSETTAFKGLSGVYPSKLTSTEMKALRDANLNYYVTVGSRDLTLGGAVRAGEWADTIRFRDWLKNDMLVRVVNVFATTPKVPFTDGGIGLIQNAMLASLKAGQDAGGIAETEYDEDGNAIPGYATSVPRSASLSQAEKASRKLTKCKFKARLAGAIHFAELKGSLTYAL